MPLELWNTDHFPGLKLLYHGPQKAQELYDEAVQLCKIHPEYGTPVREEFNDESECFFSIVAHYNGTEAGGISVEDDGDGHMYIADIEVDPAFRAKGIGKELLKHSMTIAGLRNHTFMKAIIHEDNEFSRRLFAACGAEFSELRIPKIREDSYYDVTVPVKHPFDGLFLK